MKPFARLLVFFLVLVSSGLQAATLEHASMPVSIRYGYALSPEETLETSLTMAPGIDVGFGRAGARVSARLWADDSDLLEPGRPNLSSYSGASRPQALGDWGRIELRDAYFETRTSSHLFRVGKQQIVWGALDGIKVLDVLNPQNFREFILEDFGESRIGLWSVYADLLFENWRAEIAWIPDTTAHELPVPGAWFELTAPRFRYGASPEAPGLPLTTDRSGIDDSTIASRLSWTTGRTDLSLQFVSGIDFEPLGRVELFEGVPVLEQYYQRRKLWGAKAETAFAGLALRMEVSYQPDRAFNTRVADQLDMTRLDQWRVALGVDLDGPLGIFFNMQYLNDRVMDAPDDLIRPDLDQVVTVYAQRRFAYDTLTVGLRWYGELEPDNGMARGSVDYALGDNTTLALSGVHFYGSEDGLFGQFQNRDRIQLTLRHAF